MLKKKELLYEVFSTKKEVTSLGRDLKIKLYALLCGIEVAEQAMIREGKSISRWIRIFCKRIPGGIAFFQTFGSWNMHVCHACKFGLSKKEFRKVLLQDSVGIGFVIDYILRFIGLDKEPHFIFAEYYMGAHATSIAALQKGLNSLLGKECLPLIDEDGLYGKKTEQALQTLKEVEPLEEVNEKNLLSVISKINELTQHPVVPFVPHLKSERDLKYVGSVLWQSLREPKRITRIFNFFRNRVDVPKYVAEAMHAFHIFTKMGEIL